MNGSAGGDGRPVAVNLVGITDWWELHQYERDASARRLAELAVRPIPATFDTAHLKAIHHHLFQDVYGWAGQFRTGNITKLGSLFIAHDALQTRCTELFRMLAGESRQSAAVRRSRHGQIVRMQEDAAPTKGCGRVRQCPRASRWQIDNPPNLAGPFTPRTTNPRRCRCVRFVGQVFGNGRKQRVPTITVDAQRLRSNQRCVLIDRALAVLVKKPEKEPPADVVRRFTHEARSKHA
jgi:hypothetical protein